MNERTALNGLIKTKTVIPVLKIERLEDAVPLARALISGGLNVLEVTMRTNVALEAARAMIDACPDAIVGIGTVTDPDALESANNTGAHFIVSPGTTPALLSAAAKTSVPFLPGIATVSEAIAAHSAGFSELKLFPAGVLGGTAMLKGLYPVLPGIRFCPTGGITPENAGSYLALENVFAIGGSWLAPEDLVQKQDWSAIKELAAKAAELTSS